LAFQFDMSWQAPDGVSVDPAEQADTLVSEPQVVINPELREDPIFMVRLHRP
jgi:hypothetical protein